MESERERRLSVAHVMTAAVSLGFLRGQVAFIKKRGIEIHAIASPGDALEAFGEREEISVYPVEMPRQITPLADLAALRGLVAVLRRIRPDIVHAHTPKGGLLGMLAAWLVRAPVRIYHMRGLPFVSASGAKRRLLRSTEIVSCRLSHQVLCVSHSLREVAIAERLCPASKIKVLAGGSGNGVDAAGRFDPGRLPEDAGQQRRDSLGIPGDAVVIGFVGRIVRDKGLHELAEAWTALREEFPALHLVVVGPFEPQDPLSPEVARLLHEDERIHLTGPVIDIPTIYAAVDIVALPTYREGLPNVPLEAAAMCKPVVATRIPGCVDAIADGETGILVRPRDGQALATALRQYVADPALRSQHGQAGRRRVLRNFRQETIWEALYQEYLRLFAGKGMVPPGAFQPPAGAVEERAEGKGNTK